MEGSERGSRSSRTAAAEARTATGSLPPRACSVLVIEDDEALGRLARDCLEAEGHRVVVASTLSEARAAVDRPGAAFDAIVADASLPDGDGGKFAGDLTKEKPGLAVVTGRAVRAHVASASAVALAPALRRDVVVIGSLSVQWVQE